MQDGDNLRLGRLNDEALLARSREGSEAAFTLLYQRNQGRIYRFVFSMTGSETIAEEVTQEVFLELLNGRCAFDPSKGRLASYLLGVARNQTLRQLRRSPNVEEHASEQSTAGSPAGELIRDETLAAVRRAVVSLPESYREVVAMCDLEEMDYAEAAEALACPVGTVRSRLHRARAMLAGKLEGLGITRSLA